MAMRLTGKRALVAVAAGLALVGTPAFALAAAPATAVAAEAQVRSVSTIDEFKNAINDDSVTEIDLTGMQEWNFWTGFLSQSVTNFDTIDHPVTIVNKTGNVNAYLYGATFTVQDGGKLIFQDINIDDARNEGSNNPAVKAVTVQPGGYFETKGTGDIVTDNGKDEAWAVKLEGSNDPAKKATAVLGAAPSGFMAYIGEDGWTADNAGNYGGTYCVTAGLNSDLTITDGRFTAENAAHQAIQSYGSVTIKPASDDVVFSTNNWGENAGPVGTVEIDGTLDGKATGAKLNATDTAFGYIAPGGSAEVGNVAIKAALQLNGAAKAYLANSTVNAIVSTPENGWKVGTLPAVWLDTDAKLYEQEEESSGPVTFSTNSDTPSFSEVESKFVGNHQTSGQYKASAHFDSQNAVAEDVKNPTLARGLWQVTDPTVPTDDLESLVNAQGVSKLTDGAEVAATDPSEPSQGATVTANLKLGVSKVFGKYEITKNDDTSIQGDGHAYAYSKVYDLQAGWDLTTYHSGETFTAPAAGTGNVGIPTESIPDDEVFAGWYQDARLTQPVDKNTKDGYAYLKTFKTADLDQDVKFLGGSLRMDTTSNGYKNYAHTDFRMEYTFKAPEGTTLDTTNGTGWRYSVDGKTFYKFTPEKLNKIDQQDGSVWAALQLTGMPKSAFATDIQTVGVLGYTTADGTDVQVEDHAGAQHRSAQEVATKMAAANKKPEEVKYAKGLLDALKNN